MIRKLAPIAAAAALFVAAPAMAQSKGDFTLGVGLHQVAPKSNNGLLADGAYKIQVKSALRPTITAEYFIVDNLGIELIAALPFKHDINATTTADSMNIGKIGSTSQLPPTLSLQYHFGAPEATIKPFIGAGVNYTWFYGEKTKGGLAGTELKLGNSWGLGLHAGVDFKVGNGAIRVDVRKIDIDSKVKLNKASIGTVNIDPLVYGASYVFKF
ncbi:OmpW family protein [Lysobacter pythonis]|uniref:OmpW family protein n=1 Tax=Solilutibacter pythonis TaxID=2483112 RepID=A0A3M2HT58_9GAMM|nr:OmpW family outer membrane protein [Lysobacter pythonis]RMH91003.1 OmpW family protein [Lysobacter pythonis]